MTRVGVDAGPQPAPADGGAEAAQLAAEAAQGRSTAHGAELLAARAPYHSAVHQFCAHDGAAREHHKAAVHHLGLRDEAAAVTSFDKAAEEWRQAELVQLPTAAVDELANVRAVAKEWLGATTALFGLFSLGGVIFGRDALTGLGVGPGVAVLLFALLAVVTAAASIFFGNRAAHGWPSRTEVKPEQQGDRAWEQIDQQRNFRKARKDHWNAVRCAGFSLASLVVAVTVLMGAHYLKDAPATATVVRITDASGQSVACGSLQKLTATEAVIRDSSGTDQPIPLQDREIASDTCP
jgi:hypothetical protein